MNVLSSVTENSAAHNGKIIKNARLKTIAMLTWLCLTQPVVAMENSSDEKSGKSYLFPTLEKIFQNERPQDDVSEPQAKRTKVDHEQTSGQLSEEEEVLIETIIKYLLEGNHITLRKDGLICLKYKVINRLTESFPKVTANIFHKSTIRAKSMYKENITKERKAALLLREKPETISVQDGSLSFLEDTRDKLYAACENDKHDLKLIQDQLKKLEDQEGNSDERENLLKDEFELKARAERNKADLNYCDEQLKLAKPKL